MEEKLFAIPVRLLCEGFIRIKAVDEQTAKDIVANAMQEKDVDKLNEYAITGKLLNVNIDTNITRDEVLTDITAFGCIDYDPESNKFVQAKKIGE